MVAHQALTQAEFEAACAHKMTHVVTYMRVSEADALAVEGAQALDYGVLLESGARYRGTLLAANEHQQIGFVGAVQDMSAMGYIRRPRRQSGAQ